MRPRRFTKLAVVVMVAAAVLIPPDNAVRTAPVTTVETVGAHRLVAATLASIQILPTSSTTIATSTTTSTTTTSTTAIAPAPTSAGLQPASPGEPATGDLLTRAHDALVSAVPPSWLDAVSPHLELVEGVSSSSSTSGVLRVSRYHAGGAWTRLRAVMAHEWAHHAAFRYGTHEYLGAPPAGWPYRGPQPQEAWGDCVALGLTGFDLGRFRCDPPAMDYIRDWLARGPA